MDPFAPQPPVDPLTLGDVGAPEAPATPEWFPLLAAAVVGLGYWWLHRGDEKKSRLKKIDEYDDDEWDADDEDADEDTDGEDEPPAPRRRKARKALSDDVTDSLIDEAAVVAGRGRPGDCYRATKLLRKGAGLAKGSGERKLFKKTVAAVAKQCRGAEDEIERAIDEDARRAEEAASMFPEGTGGSAPAAKDVSAAIETWLELDPAARRGEIERELQSDDDDGDDYGPNPYDPASYRRKSKTTATRKQSGRGQRAKPGFVQKTKSGAKYRVTQKPDSRIKRGYRWQKQLVK